MVCCPLVGLQPGLRSYILVEPKGAGPKGLGRNTGLYLPSTCQFILALAPRFAALLLEIPPAFQEQMRDGTPFYHIAPCPVGRAHNMPSPSREAKIKCRKKGFQLRYQHFIERGFTDLITQRFSIVNAIVDIRVVWNSKLNGHNATLWASGFMLDDIRDVVKMVTKWLAVPVAAYLNAGLPSQDYTQSASTCK